MKSDLQTYVENFDVLTRTSGVAAPSLPSLERFVLMHGKEWVGRSRPEDVPKLPNMQCFRNAGDIALYDPRYIYVEGVARNPAHGLFIHHAWLSTREGVLVDPTWREPEKCEYMGIPFRAEFHRARVLATGYWNLLGNWRDDFRLEKGEWPKEEWLNSIDPSRFSERSG